MLQAVEYIAQGAAVVLFGGAVVGGVLVGLRAFVSLLRGLLRDYPVAVLLWLCFAALLLFLLYKVGESMQPILMG